MDHKKRFKKQLDKSLLLFDGVPARLHEVSNDLPNWNQGTTECARRVQKSSRDETTHRLWTNPTQNLCCLFNREGQSWQGDFRFAVLV